MLKLDCLEQSPKNFRSVREMIDSLPAQTPIHSEPKRYRFILVPPDLESLETEVNAFVAENQSYRFTQVIFVAGSGFLAVLEDAERAR